MRGKRDMIKTALGYGLELGGGAAAGYLDAKYPDKTLWNGGPGYGVALAAGGLALGILGVGGRYSKFAGELGAGAAAFEVGKMVAQRTGGSTSSAQIRSGVRGVGALPRGRAVSQAEIRQALRELATA
jgi:hypothetical protein